MSCLEQILYRLFLFLNFPTFVYLHLLIWYTELNNYFCLAVYNTGERFGIECCDWDPSYTHTVCVCVCDFMQASGVCQACMLIFLTSTNKCKTWFLHLVLVDSQLSRSNLCKINSIGFSELWYCLLVGAAVNHTDLTHTPFYSGQAVNP